MISVVVVQDVTVVPGAVTVYGYEVVTVVVSQVEYVLVLTDISVVFSVFVTSLVTSFVCVTSFVSVISLVLVGPGVSIVLVT